MSDLISRQAAIDAVLGVVPYDEYWKEQIEKAVNALPSAQPEQRWIPCSERLPEEYPEATLFKDDQAQYICMNETARAELAETLEKNLKKREKELQELKELIKTVER